MKHATKTSRFIIRAAVAVLTAVPLAALTPPTVTFNLTNVEGQNLAGVYTSPYIGNVGGGATIPVICDDFSDNSYLPESWTAYETSLAPSADLSVPSIYGSSGPLSYLKWKGANSLGGIVTKPSDMSNDLGSPSNPYPGWNLSQSQAYTVAAILTLEILQDNNPTDPTSPTHNNTSPTYSPQHQEDLSFALWELFDPTSAAGAANENWGSNSDAVTTWPYLSASDLNNATQYLESAINTSASALNGYAVTIYSYNGPGVGPGTFGSNTPDPSCGGSTCASAPPQEFISITQSSTTTYNNQSVPEGSSLYEFPVYGLAGGIALLFFRRRSLNPQEPEQ